MDQNLPFVNHLFQRKSAYTLSFLLILFVFSIAGHFQPQYSLLNVGLLSEILPNSGRSAPQPCDYSKGRWVRDETRPLQSYTENCSFLDPGFRCYLNGRSDNDYINWRWQPNGCDLPRFNGSEMLERSRNGRIVFVGDSIGRNQWESFVCMLTRTLSNQSRVYETNGNPITKHKGYLSIGFQDYNVTVEYYRAPFLVTLDHPPNNSSPQVRTVIRVDKLHWISQQWVGADVLVFNAGHWWNQDKTINMGHYFQEGDFVKMEMEVNEAFRKALNTWKKWVIQNFQQGKSHVFFRSYSPIHYRGGTWDKDGRCDTYTRPQTNYTELETEPWNNLVISETVRQIKGVLKSKVQLLNITYLTEFRTDGHPSIHREAGTPEPIIQDCSHWCLPGVPDTWNELLYAYLLSKGYNTSNGMSSSMPTSSQRATIHQRTTVE